MSSRRGQLRIGTSGYMYKHWKDVFYPKDLPQKKWFAHYAEHFDTVEINNSFYHLPSAETFSSWREQAPESFLYAVKYSRFATHMKKLKDPEEPLELFLSHAENLGETFGPILVQLPPHWHADVERLDAFLDAAPKRHRWALEFRDPSWVCDGVFRVLEKHQAAFCIHDKLDDLPWKATTDWVYLRFHGNDYSSDYSAQKLTACGQKIGAFLENGLDVYAYFNNDAHGYAVRNAVDLKRYCSHRIDS